MTPAVIRSVLLTIGIFLLALAAATDVRSRIIPNTLVLSVAVTGLLLGALTRPLSLWINIVVAVFVVLALTALSHLDSLGGGDIKLMAATTFLVPPMQIVGLLGSVALAGGILSLLYLAFHYTLKNLRTTGNRDRRRHSVPRWWHHERARIADGRTVPYAVAISGGSITYIIAEWYRCLSATSCSL